MPPLSWISCTLKGMNTAKLSVVRVRKALILRTPMGRAVLRPVKLLELENRKLAHVLSCHGKHRLGVAVKLLLGVGGDGQGNHRKHHALVAGGEIVQNSLLSLR